GRGGARHPGRVGARGGRQPHVAHGVDQADVPRAREAGGPDRVAVPRGLVREQVRRGGRRRHRSGEHERRDLGDVHARRRARGRRDPAHQQERPARSHELPGRDLRVQLAHGDRRVPAVGAARGFPEGLALLEGARREDQGEMVARLAALIALLLAGAVSAQDYPSRTIRMVVAFPPGGIADFAARSVSSGLTEALRVPVVVENRSGAGGSIGADFVAKAAPDGYTVLVTSISHTINPAFMKKLPFDTRRDYARAHPGALAYASSGVGTSTHLCGELFKQMAKVDVVHVPYKGGGPAVADLLGGQVQMMFATLPTVLEHARSGRLRAIATTGAQRFAGAREF